MRFSFASIANGCLLLGLLVAGPSAADNPNPWEYLNYGVGSIRGMVIVGGYAPSPIGMPIEPIAGCSVSVWSVSNPLSGSAVPGRWVSMITDKNGEFGVISAGFYLDSLTPVRAKKEGYQETLTKVQLSHAETTTVTLGLIVSGTPLSERGPHPVQAAMSSVRISDEGDALIVDIPFAQYLSAEFYSLSGRRLYTGPARRFFSAGRHRIGDAIDASGPAVFYIEGCGFQAKGAVFHPKR